MTWPLVPEVESLQDAIQFMLRRLLSRDARKVDPRGLATTEVLGAAIRIADPRRRLVIRPAAPRWSLPFAMAEYLWYMRGENSVDSMAYYAPSMRAFSDDDVTLNSAYGYRIFGGHELIGFDQWESAKRLLISDPASRQAVIQIRSARDALLVTKDHPCTVALQFLQRDGALHMVTTMRSNDVMFGTAYDIFSFTMMQEQMAFELGFELGSYYHQVASWHLYDRQRGAAEEMAELTISPHAMPAVEVGLPAMIEDEVRIRLGNRVDPGEGYWRDWRLTLMAFGGGFPGEPPLRPNYREAWDRGRQRRRGEARDG